ncbi:MAG: hypothetical protein COT91_01625 [Candidatus Doudnabacteria bacterium CG10_big_fil_rev_8_21_14_0_10_41_10]|uniref:PEP-utilising enzyme mobile domain-containing protein n=1 Tax=Candidatus Doudnabacteria bacterium CG10_big_fil_rev_8_21_14_0_10_41_10 TaxID=1974551 RepID=A0A2H0VGA4_9BACT|nr:MAG: hypothetical protein COT91_01625 [Candidatus Doudnabacteria bacterium CG10_big_fil_rev_8_21_14_0_10_41_10]
MNSKFFKHNDWGQIWAGSWSVHTCSHLGNHLTKDIVFGGKSFLRQSAIIVVKGKSACWAREADRDRVGKYLVRKASRDGGLIKEICNALKKEADKILTFIDKYQSKKLTLNLYREFWGKVAHYYQRHLADKYFVDYLEQDLLKKFLPVLEEARLYAEPVFKRIEDFTEAYAKSIGRQTNKPEELILCMNREEMEDYLKNKSFPIMEELKVRFKKTAMLFDRKTYILKTGEQAENIEEIILRIPASKIIKGQPAYAGKAKGKVRIIWEPKKVKLFNAGDILVTGMTRPEFLPFMKKSAAFVTDAGGILSHAAITARELKKPCIIGTKVATKVLKDGDLVEVDANKGIVRLVKTAVRRVRKV